MPGRIALSVLAGVFLRQVGLVDIANSALRCTHVLKIAVVPALVFGIHADCMAVVRGSTCILARGGSWVTEAGLPCAAQICPLPIGLSVTTHGVSPVATPISIYVALVNSIRSVGIGWLRVEAWKTWRVDRADCNADWLRLFGMTMIARPAVGRTLAWHSKIRGATVPGDWQRAITWNTRACQVATGPHTLIG